MAGPSSPRRRPQMRRAGRMTSTRGGGREHFVLRPRGGPRLRDRRGRGLRGVLLPSYVPAAASRSQSFDAAVLEAFAPIDARWHDRLADLDIAVDEIPRILPKDPESVSWPEEVTADGAVPLARLVPISMDKGQATRARIVLFRRPIEARAKHEDDLLDLIHEILVQQVAVHLGVDEDTIDPPPQ